MTKKERARLRKMAHKLWMDGALEYLRTWLNELELRLHLDGEVFTDKKTGVIVFPTKSQARAFSKQRISKLVNKRKK